MELNKKLCPKHSQTLWLDDRGGEGAEECAQGPGGGDLHYLKGSI